MDVEMQAPGPGRGGGRLRATRAAVGSWASLGVLVAAGALLWLAQPGSDLPPVDVSASPLFRTGRAAGLSYLEMVTGGSADRRLPLVVFVHGLGSSAPPPKEALSLTPHAAARVVFPQAEEPFEGGFAWYPVRVRDGDVARLSAGASASAARLAGLVEEVAAERPTRGRAVLAGFSQGGIVSFCLAVQRPDLFRYVIPVAGWLPPPLWPGATHPRQPPICALHGTADRVVPLVPTRVATSHLSSLGFVAELEEMPGLGHSFDDRVKDGLLRRIDAVLALPDAPQRCVPVPPVHVPP